METHLEDQMAALTYLKGLPEVDPKGIAVAGCSFGGIQTVLMAERGLAWAYGRRLILQGRRNRGAIRQS